MTDFQKNLDQWVDILNKLKFDIQPIAFKYCVTKPDGLDRLDKKVAFCEMMKTAQEGKAFYADPENHDCFPGLFVMGGDDKPVMYKSGVFGAEGEWYDEPRACRKLYECAPMLEKDTVKYVAFSPLDKLSFEPDLLILVAKVEQTAILVRAMSYGTGKSFVSQCTPVLACAWIFNQPYLTGEMNYITTGIGIGMTRRKVVPPGLQLMSIPYDLFSTMLESLQKMPWVHPLFKPGAEEWMQQLRTRLGIK